MLRLTCAVAGLILFAACSSQKAAVQADEPASAAAAPSSSGTLYERLGGKPAIEAVIDDFLGRVAADDLINAGFAGSNVPKLRQRLVELVCMASKGPCTYSGRDMKTVHKGMKVTEAQFDALVGHLVASLNKFKVPEREKGDLLGLLGPMKPDIVEEP